MLTHSHPELAGAKYAVFVDASRRYVDCTDGVCELLGYSLEQMLGKRIEDISYDVHAVPKLFAQLVQDGTQHGEYILQRRDQTPQPIRYRAFVFADGCHAAIWEPVSGWRQPYLAALLEVDAEKQGYKIERAMAAIQANADAPPSEQRLMNDARSMLAALQKMAKAATRS